MTRGANTRTKGSSGLSSLGNTLYRAADLWGFTRSDKLLFAALLITGGFVLLEVRYNIALLNTVIDPSATHERVQALSEQGKLLASLGISWAAGRFLLERVRPALIGLLLLAGLSFTIYRGLDHVYTTSITTLPPEIKLKGFQLFSYRREVLTDQSVARDIPRPAHEPIAGRIVMGAFPIMLFDDRYMLPASESVMRTADDKVRDAVQQAEQRWPEYERQMSELRDSHREFVEASKRAADEATLGGLEQFRQQSGGFEPNPAITLEQFVDMIRSSQHPKGRTLREAEATEMAKRFDGTALLTAEVPKFMDHSAFTAWFTGQAELARDAALPTVANIGSMNGIQEINAAIFLPPMAMIASLTSAVTNGITFALLALVLAARGTLSARVHRAGAWLDKFGTPIMVLLLALLLLAMPSHVFAPGSMRALETKMHDRVGLAGKIWSRLSSLEALILPKR